MMNTRVVHQSFFRIIEAMVWQADDKQVFPLRKSFELINKFSKTIVSEGKSIRNFFFQTMIGYFKRFMAAQGKESSMPGLVSVSLLYLTVEVLEGDVIVYSPWVFRSSILKSTSAVNCWYPLPSK